MSEWADDETRQGSEAIRAFWHVYLGGTRCPYKGIVQKRCVMPDDTDEIVGSIGHELVSRLAPEELPLYPSLVKQFQGAKRGGRGKESSDDQLLGFGAAEAITMLTPVILSFTGSFWKALVAEAATDSAHGVVEYLKTHLLGRHGAAAGPPLTPGQLQHVRAVAEREARGLDISEAQAGLFADAMVGALTAPLAS
jgi:hypothetical protein